MSTDKEGSASRPQLTIPDWMASDCTHTFNDFSTEGGCPKCTQTNTSGKAHCPHDGICHTSDETCAEAQVRVESIKALDGKCYRLDPAVNTVTDLVTDDQVHSTFQGTNFGHDDFRGLLAQGCIKALAGWHQGHTLTTILDELRLIAWDKQTDKIKVTAKGRHYIWLAFKGRPGV